MIPPQLAAHRPVILDPKIQNEPDDDVREMKTRDEIVRQSEIEEALKLPTAAERDRLQAAKWQDFAKDVRTFDSLIADLSKFRPDGTYPPQTVKAVQKKSKDVEHSVQRILIFLGAGKDKNTISESEVAADTIEERTGLLCLLAVRLDPALHQLLTLELHHVSDAGLREKVVGQLHLIAFLSKRRQD
jgi:hypothetical protein